jgi:double-stranded uracil-DNA glycosylase
MNATSGFAPILGQEATVLILGTLPSQQSLRIQQYYGHPQNAFWRIMGELIGAGPELPYEVRTGLLASKGFAVWDVLASGTRPGSMDAAIDAKSALPNDFESLTAIHPELSLVCFNGKAAAKLFRQLVPTTVQRSFRAARFVTMPSTSPAYAAMGFSDKLEKWATILAPQPGKYTTTG